MKNQYFGDINDYRKYGLLRVLSNGGSIHIAVCWMLTEDDTRSDGNKISYLNEPLTWRGYDPELFDMLHTSIHKYRIRSVKIVQRAKKIPNSLFYSRYLTDDVSQREKYFSQLHSVISGADLLFFDPDNGIEVPSVTYGKKNSSKYLYRHEIEMSFHAGHSLLLYQHFPRVKRRLYISEKMKELKSLLKISTTVALQTPTVVYFLLPQQHHVGYFRARVAELQRRWGRNFIITM